MELLRGKKKKEMIKYKAITGTHEQVTDFIFDVLVLNEKDVIKDECGYPKVEMNYLEGSELVTLVWMVKVKKPARQPKRADLHAKAQEYDWQVDKNEGKYQILSRNNKVMYECKTLTGIQRKLNKMIWEYRFIKVDVTDKPFNSVTEFYQHYNVI